MAEALKRNPGSRQFQQFLAGVRDDLGQEAWKRREFTTALAYWESALQADPSDAAARENLGIARDFLNQQRQQGAAVANAQQAITQLVQTVQNKGSSGGLGLGDFDGGTSSSASRSGSNQAGSATVVDARKVSSGLPKAVDDVIAATYRNTSLAVSDRARKGFQAIAARDWKVARAWFQDALNRDPGNADLKRMVDLAESTEKFYQDAANQNAALLAQPIGSPELAAAIQANAKGDAAEAIRQLERTKVVYPESVARVDAMIERIRLNEANVAGMADYQRKQADFVVTLEQDSLNFLLMGNYREADRLSRDAAFFAMFVDRQELEAANARVWAPQH
jgi:tetratricopeptide (TPR) repeat protein